MCMKGKPNAKAASIIDATQAPYTIFGIGIRKKNPRRCIVCGEPIKPGERWQRDAGVYDPKYKRIVVVRHSPSCPGLQVCCASQQTATHGESPSG